VQPDLVSRPATSPGCRSSSPRGPRRAARTRTGRLRRAIASYSGRSSSPRPPPPPLRPRRRLPSARSYELHHGGDAREPLELAVATAERVHALDAGFFLSYTNAGNAHVNLASTASSAARTRPGARPGGGGVRAGARAAPRLPSCLLGLGTAWRIRAASELARGIDRRPRWTRSRHLRRTVKLIPRISTRHELVKVEIVAVAPGDPWRLAGHAAAAARATLDRARPLDDRAVAVPALEAELELVEAERRARQAWPRPSPSGSARGNRAGRELDPESPELLRSRAPC